MSRNHAVTQFIKISILSIIISLSASGVGLGLQISQVFLESV